MGTASRVSSSRMGTITVSVAGMRVANRLLTASLVAQLLAPVEGDDLLEEDAELHVGRLVQPELLADGGDLLGRGVLAGQDRSAGSLPKKWNSRNTSSTTPTRVGTICHRRRIR
jgi:hypothetical protein